jgi:hypothetical protein
LSLSDGSRVTVRNWKLSSEDLLSVEAVYGGSLEVPTSAVVSLQFFGGRADYLSDLKPLEYRFQPYLLDDWPLVRDLSVTGDPLRVRGREFSKGLGMHSSSEVVFDLAGEYRQFQATAGINDATRGRGSAVLAVEVDGRRVYTSGLVTGSSPAEEIGPIDVSGAKRLKLIVEFGEFGDVLDHVDWCNALLVK